VSFNAEDFNQVVEKYHLALGEFMKGNPAPAKKLYSQRDDVTLGNPFGPFARGWKQVVETMEQAASNYRDGGFVTVTGKGRHYDEDGRYPPQAAAAERHCSMAPARKPRRVRREIR
jgi:hypothetical protein